MRVSAHLAALALGVAACRPATPSHRATSKVLGEPIYQAPSGPALAFGIQEGKLRNYFYRQGVSAAHLLTRSGDQPRIIVAFPANNQGVGIWFHGRRAVELWAGETPDANAMGKALHGVVRRDGDRDRIGVRTTIRSDARTLRAFLTLLGSVRTLRDYGYGVCLEDAGRHPELRNETIELDREHNAVRVRREQIDGHHTLELWLRGRGDTLLALREGEVTARPECAAAMRGSVARRELSIEASGRNGVDLELVALSDEKPLTPVAKEDLFLVQPALDGLDADALAFLSYEEKLLAGSWRFLTYFGRDTLLSLRLLMPILKSDFVERALGSVLERINLRPDLRDPDFGAIEIGEVAHEEEVGDYAAFRNKAQGRAPGELCTPRYDYKMIDDDFLLAPVLAGFLEKHAGASDAFLSSTRGDGKTFLEALLANLSLVRERARPFADEHGTVSNKKRKLVALKPRLSVGEWRDSETGLAFGRYPFDVNAGLVPAALAGAASLYGRLGMVVESNDAERLLAGWQGVEALFGVNVPIEMARANITSYAASLGVSDASGALESEAGGMYRYHGIALDEHGVPLPVLHSDHAFVMEFARPSESYLKRAAATIARSFPAGLMSNVGLLVASPALAPANLVVENARDGAPVPIRDLFTRSHYHGTVVWSWQQALLASGLRRQLERNDLTPPTRVALEQCECALWEAIAKTEAARAGELWSWETDARGGMRIRAFGDVRADVDESNAIQLWSTVYLAVKRPSLEQNRRCKDAR